MRKTRSRLEFHQIILVLTFAHNFFQFFIRFKSLKMQLIQLALRYQQLQKHNACVVVGKNKW